MRVLLLALPGTDHTALRTSLAAALGATAVDVCQAVEAGVTWLENRPCDLVAVAGPAAGVRDCLGRLRRASRAIPVLALLPETASPDAGAAWLAGADDVLTIGSLSGATPPEGLDELRNGDRDVARRIQKLWYAGPGDPLRQQLHSRLATRFRDVGLTGEGLSGLTTQDFEAPQSAALVVNALSGAEAMVLGVRRVKRTYPALAVTVVADAAHHDAFRRAGADECVGGSPAVESVLHAVGRAQARCRTTVELDALRARETRLRALVEQLPEAVVLVSPEHAVLAVNVAGLRLIGAHDARQVLGAPLAPWVQADTDDGLTNLVDTVVGGATRDIVATTSQLADPRRLLVRAVPFQRESGGRPAALMVLRDMASEPVDGAHVEGAGPATATEDLLRAWDEERAALSTRIAQLEEDLAHASGLADRIPVLEEALTTAVERQQALEPAQQMVAKLAGFGVEVDRIPELLDAAEHLVTLQTQLPALRARLQELELIESEVVPSLRAELAHARAAAVAPENLEALRLGAERLYELEHVELPAIRAAAAEQAALHEMAASAVESLRERIVTLESALADASAASEASQVADRARHDEHVQALERRLAEQAAETEALDSALARIRDLEAQLTEPNRPMVDDEAYLRRIAELEEQVAEAAVQRMALQADAARAQELERQLDEVVGENLALEANLSRLSSQPQTPAFVAQAISPEQAWLLEDVAALGVVQADVSGHVFMANDHAARACGFGSGDELVRAGMLPEPVRALAGDDLDAASRFEVCLQTDDDTTARWVAGVRLPRRDDSHVTWWLADVTVRQPIAAREQVRVQAMSSVLEVATAQCASLVPTPASRVLGPRPVDVIDEQPDEAAVARAHVMLGQLTALGRRRGATRAEDLRTRLSSLAPLLERLGGDDIAWDMAVPDHAVHACVNAAEFERCVTALVTSGRDALPLGGRLSLVLQEDVALEGMGIRRPESLLSLEVQGYGLTEVRVPDAVRDLVHGMGARLEVTTVDALGTRIHLRVPRAFLLTHAA